MKFVVMINSENLVRIAARFFVAASLRFNPGFRCSTSTLVLRRTQKLIGAISFGASFGIDMVRIGFLLSVIALTLPARACWQEAGNRYQIDARLLYAIARTESGLNPAATHRNGDGSTDIGLMQINSAWFPALAKHGISVHELWEPCTNIHVGAWVLAQKVRKFGMTWDAVGAYNATTPFKRSSYAWKVYRNLESANRERQP